MQYNAHLFLKSGNVRLDALQTELDELLAQLAVRNGAHGVDIRRENLARDDLAHRFTCGCLDERREGARVFRGHDGALEHVEVRLGLWIRRFIGHSA